MDAADGATNGAKTDGASVLLEADDNYQLLAATERVLVAQEAKARRDIERLVAMRAAALADPEAYVRSILDGTVEKAPGHQAIATVPRIDWTQYTSGYRGNRRLRSRTAMAASMLLGGPAPTAPMDESLAGGPAMGTMIEVMGAQAARARASMQVSRLSSMSTKVDESTPGTPTAQPSAPLSPAVPAVAAPPISHKKGASSSSSATNSRPAQTQRAPSTGGTYGLPWTEEEKRHFKELLLIYPDEDVIIQRCAKISRALGTRTPQQVCSRMQKYFIELAKNHKPIPGRLNSDYKSYGRGTHSHSSSSSHQKYSSTMPSADGETPGTKRMKMISDEDNDDMSRERSARATTSRMHIGFQCDSCGMEPIVGTRWTCVDCAELDLCNQCDRATFTKGGHIPEHRFDKVEQAEPAHFMDQDYNSLMGEYNYLDPNFNPP